MLSIIFGCAAIVWVSEVTLIQIPPTSGNNPANPNVIVAMGLVDVEAGVSRLSTEMPGRILRIEAKEDQVYEAGDFLLSVDDSNAKLKQAEKALIIAEKKLLQAQTAVQIAVAEMNAQNALIEAALAREETYKARQKELKNIEQVPRATVREIEDAVREVGYAINAEKAKLAVIEARKALAQHDVDLAQTQVEAQKIPVMEAKKAMEDCVLKAPFKGKVLRLKAKLGELVGPISPEPLIEYCPETPRIIRGEISQEFASSAKVGQTCRITDDSRSSSVIGTGKIQRISDWIAPRRSILFEPLQLNDQRTVECLITLDPDSEPLRIGQRVRITVELNKTISPTIQNSPRK